MFLKSLLLTKAAFVLKKKYSNIVYVMLIYFKMQFIPVMAKLNFKQLSHFSQMFAVFFFLQMFEVNNI